MSSDLQAERYKAVGIFLKNRREELRFSRDDIVFELQQRRTYLSVTSLFRIESGVGDTIKTYMGDSDFLQAYTYILRISVHEVLVRAGHLVQHPGNAHVHRVREWLPRLSEENQQKYESILKLFMNE